MIRTGKLLINDNIFCEDINRGKTDEYYVLTRSIIKHSFDFKKVPNYKCLSLDNKHRLRKYEEPISHYAVKGNESNTILADNIKRIEILFERPAWLIISYEDIEKYCLRAKSEFLKTLQIVEPEMIAKIDELATGPINDILKIRS